MCQDMPHCCRGDAPLPSRTCQSLPASVSSHRPVPALTNFFYRFLNSNSSMFLFLGFPQVHSHHPRDREQIPIVTPKSCTAHSTTGRLCSVPPQGMCPCHDFHLQKSFLHLLTLLKLPIPASLSIRALVPAVPIQSLHRLMHMPQLLSSGYIAFAVFIIAAIIYLLIW